MKEISNRSELLEKLTNISEECSEIELDAINFELSSEDETVHIQSETSETQDSDEESITNYENESVINIPRKRCTVVQTVIKKLKISFRRPKQLPMVLCGQNLTKMVFLDGYHLLVLSRV